MTARRRFSRPVTSVASSVGLTKAPIDSLTRPTSTRPAPRTISCSSTFLKVPPDRAETDTEKPAALSPAPAATSSAFTDGTPTDRVVRDVERGEPSLKTARCARAVESCDIGLLGHEGLVQLTLLSIAVLGEPWVIQPEV